jgi:hypothetical protein
MLKGLLVGAVLAVSSLGFAATTLVDTVASVSQHAVLDQAHTMGLDWKVGESCNYKVDMGFIQGSMVMSVREIAADGIWMVQDVDLGFAGKQKMESLIDPNTGEVKKMLVNGKEQAVPKNNTEVVEVKEDHITVPAGSFDCIHARLKDKDSNEESNAWLNPSAVPLSGLLQVKQPSQLGEVTISLVSFKKL